MSVNLPVGERDVGARRDPQQVDHSGRGSEGERQKERAEDEVRREGERRALRGSGGVLPHGRDVAHRGGADGCEELVERNAMHRREPGDGLVRPVIAAAVSQAELLEDGDRRLFRAALLGPRTPARADERLRSRCRRRARPGRRRGADTFRESPGRVSWNPEKGGTCWDRLRRSLGAVAPYFDDERGHGQKDQPE